MVVMRWRQRLAMVASSISAARHLLPGIIPVSSLLSERDALRGIAQSYYRQPKIYSHCLAATGVNSLNLALRGTASCRNVAGQIAYIRAQDIRYLPYRHLFAYYAQNPCLTKTVLRRLGGVMRRAQCYKSSSSIPLMRAINNASVGKSLNNSVSVSI